MQIIRSFLIISLASIVLGNAGAKTEANTDFTAKLKKLQARVVAPKSKFVNFNQSIYKSFRKKTIKSSGHALFGAPNKFRWVLEKPVNEELIYNGKKFYQYRPDEMVAVEFPGMSNEGKNIDQLVNMVLDLKKLLKRYKVTKFEEQKPNISLEMIPNAKNEELNSVNLTIKADDGAVKKIVLNYATGDITTIEFTEAPKKVDAKMFDFTPPAGVKMTKPSKMGF